MKQNDDRVTFVNLVTFLLNIKIIVNSALWMVNKNTNVHILIYGLSSVWMDTSNNTCINLLFIYDLIFWTGLKLKIKWPTVMANSKVYSNNYQ